MFFHPRVEWYEIEVKINIIVPLEQKSSPETFIKLELLF